MTSRSAADAGDTQRFFFVHIMKTGGTSLVFHLLANFAPNEVYPGERDKRAPDDVEPYASIADVLALSPERREEVRFYSGHFPYFVRDLLGVDVATLTLLRDPVDRTVSVLRHFKRLWPRFGDSSLDAIYDDEFVFRHYIENFQTRVFALTRDDAARSFASTRGYREIRDALADPAPLPRPSEGDTIPIDDQRLAVAQTNLARVDVVGVSERFPVFVEQLRARFGWWPAGLDVGARANVSTEGWDVRPSLRRRIVLDNAYDAELHRFASELPAACPD